VDPDVIVSNAVLMEIAQRQPRTIEQLPPCPGLASGAKDLRTCHAASHHAFLIPTSEAHMQIQFWGAARTVTGTMHLLTINGQRLLLDCNVSGQTRYCQRAQQSIAV
jgi:hypothetical protein